VNTIRELTDREKAILRVALRHMAADETPFDIGEGFSPADEEEVEAVADLMEFASGLI
jgi:hypothetical protein